MKNQSNRNKKSHGRHYPPKPMRDKQREAQESQHSVLLELTQVGEELATCRRQLAVAKDYSNQWFEAHEAEWRAHNETQKLLAEAKREIKSLILLSSGLAGALTIVVFALCWVLSR